jgi:hypothetical protein
MPICLDAAGGSLTESGFGRGNVLEMVGTELRADDPDHRTTAAASPAQSSDP